MKVEIIFKNGRKLFIDAANIDLVNDFGKFELYALDLAGEEHRISARHMVAEDVNEVYIDGKLEFRNKDYKRI